jgi:hypothetical protein
VAYALCGLVVLWRTRPLWASRILLPIGGGIAAAVAFAIELLSGASPEIRIWLHAIALGLQSLGWRALAGRLPSEMLSARAERLALLTVIVPAFASVAPPALALVSCPGSSGLATRTEVLLASVAALLAIGAVRRLGLRFVLGTALALLGWIALAPGEPLVVPLVGLALLASVARAPLIGSLALLALSAIATHAHFRGPGPTAVALALCAVLALSWSRAKTRDSAVVARATGVSLLVAIALAVLWIAGALSTGRHPPLAVLAPIAAALLAGSLALGWLGRRARSGGLAVQSVARGGLTAATFTAALALVACPPPTLLDVRVVSLGALATGTLLLATGRSWMLDAAALALPALYALARWHGLPGSTDADAIIALGAAHAAFWFGARESRHAASLRRAAIGWPALAALLCLALSPGAAAAIALLTGIHYAVMSRVAGARWLMLPASAFANAGLLLSSLSLGIADPLVWTLPVGLSLLFLVHLYSEELGRGAAHSLRVILVAAIHGVALASSVGLSPLRSLVIVPALCVLGMIAGVVLRVRAYLLVGVAFLAADLGLELFRHGLQSRPLAAVFLTALGLALVAAMVLFSIERERILRRYSLVVGEITTWQ